MIESIDLRHFQPHATFQLDLDPRVTVLVGPSERGKSSVLRALRWVSLNKPKGDKFVGKFGKAPFAHVRLRFDGHKVSRLRGGKRNEYRFDGGPVMRDFRQGIPANVERILNLGDGNFQRQLDAPHWFLLAPGQLSKELNAIVNLSAIDSALAKAGKRVRKDKTAVDVSRSRLSTARKKLRELAWVPVIEERVRRIDRLTEKLRSTEKTAGMLAIAIKSLQTNRRRLADIRAVLRHKRVLNRVYSQLTGAQADVDTLQSALRRIEQLEALATTNVPTISRLTRLRDRCTDAEWDIRQLVMYTSCIAQLKHELRDLNTRLTETKTRIRKAVKVRCPTCGQPIKDPSSSPAVISTFL